MTKPTMAFSGEARYESTLPAWQGYGWVDALISALDPGGGCQFATRGTWMLDAAMRYSRYTKTAA